jgi:hypothetical protein
LIRGSHFMDENFSGIKNDIGIKLGKSQK